MVESSSGPSPPPGGRTRSERCEGAFLSLSQTYFREVIAEQSRNDHAVGDARGREIARPKKMLWVS
jgi:hypothetical protein